MTENITSVGASRSESGVSALKGRTGAGAPAEARGKTTIADTVVAKIAGMAAREIPGIHSLGAGMARAFGAMRERVPGGGGAVTRGVKVEVGERQAAVDLDVVVEYGVAIVDVAGAVRTNVISAVERMTGLEVVEVNITVDDVHLPDEEEEAETDEGRVR
ncbi:Asp23/Gls24 family envelope stress response protein [Streptomyces sp. SID486]|uniref:Asp23/Gls24 family envelope stress response protein n=1 Tax=unclassified Streptomyces TaxID=2593676 RepID=UPI001368C6D7|nr:MULTISPECIES: Asp23/Gls24 family envelope stress response protein [unclassified Streptomyces]MYW16256.1 Asp23/Gls24 family envelope stress response protein [Streptomyces sp. SID2955]MYW21423.1 Asp23/Gls24 family envelope stress response protein [Streptomyces sp. SID2955]MYW49070.1 Asp23/Gls24 family envelope stress response protein [Streptomyces sp. SID161]MYX98613.1 Asp23/Gls24 family envelope stress response protein [Streptomyces sp. SID486]